MGIPPHKRPEDQPKGFRRVTRSAALSHQEVEVLATYNAEVYRGIVHTPEYDAKMAELQGRSDMADLRGHRDGRPEPQSDGYFEPTPGAPADACPLCGIHRRHAGDPLACGEGWKQPGCFDPKAKP